MCSNKTASHVAKLKIVCGLTWYYPLVYEADRDFVATLVAKVIDAFDQEGPLDKSEEKLITEEEVKIISGEEEQSTSKDSEDEVSK